MTLIFMMFVGTLGKEKTSFYWGYHPWCFLGFYKKNVQLRVEKEQNLVHII